ncbi:MAG: ABC transporter permease [Nitrospirae bacterium]|nr:ABC transporter permease [Nitrospirota bacterium]
MVLAMAIGVAAVVVLTALGEGARRYVVGEFASLGTNLVIVLPGRSETTGGPPPLTGLAPRDLTIADAQALLASPAITDVAPVVVGAAPVAAGGREREVLALGSTRSLLPVRHMTVAEGRFLPGGDPERGPPVAVLGATLRRELFGNRRAVGEQIRIGDRRFRVVGVLTDTGRSVGLDLNDLVVIPVAQAQALLNAPSLFRILAQARGPAAIAQAQDDIRATIRARHEGEDDVTVITQDSVMNTFDAILGTLTLVVGGIAAISLVVAGILVMNVMLVAVSHRTAEIGLLKAIGARPGVVLRLFLAEAALLSVLGAAGGLALGYGGVALIGALVPDFPVAAPAWAVAAALLVATGTGLLFGVWPARRAARLDPVQALARR